MKNLVFAGIVYFWGLIGWGVALMPAQAEPKHFDVGEVELIDGGTSPSTGAYDQPKWRCIQVPEALDHDCRDSPFSDCEI